MKKISAIRILSLLTAGLLASLAGCSGGARNAPTTAVGTTAAETEEATRTEDPENTKAFQTYCDDLFADIMSDDLISAHFYLTHPENYGIDLSDPHFPDYSEEAMEKDYEEDQSYLDRLHAIDRAALGADDRLLYDICEQTLDSDLALRDVAYLAQPLNPDFGVEAQLPTELVQYRFDSTADVDAVISYVSQFGDLFDQLADYEQRRIDRGVPVDDETLDRIISSLQPYLVSPEDNILVTTLPEKLDALGLSEEEKKSYESRMLSAVSDSMLPAYKNLESRLEGLKGQRKTTTGLAGYDGGKEYFTVLLRSMCGTSSDPEELESRIEERLDTDLTTLSGVLRSDKNFDTSVEAGAGMTDPAEILTTLRKAADDDFPAIGDIDYTVKTVPDALSPYLSPAFYYIPTLDGSETNTIYINPGATASGSLFNTLAHEGYPGHMYQTNYFKENIGSPLRYLLAPTGYSEGWGLYAEIYADQMDQNLSGTQQTFLMSEQASNYALYAMLDLRINYDGWDLKKTGDYLRRYYSIDDSAVEDMYSAIADTPGNYLAYYTGYLEITDLRRRAEDTLGPSFSRKDFHKFILDMAGADFGLIGKRFESWLTEKGADQPS